MRHNRLGGEPLAEAHPRSPILHTLVLFALAAVLAFALSRPVNLLASRIGNRSRFVAARTLRRVDDARLAACPACGATLPVQPVHSPAAGVPVARVVALIGGLALGAAYFMPWFGSQGVILTGAFLDQLLGSTSDLRRLLPGSAGGPLEVQLLRTLVDLFPIAGGLAALVSLLVTMKPAWRVAGNVVVGACGALALVALAGGVARLPPGATWEVGLWLIGAGSVTILTGVALDVLKVRR